VDQLPRGIGDEQSPGDTGSGVAATSSCSATWSDDGVEEVDLPRPHPLTRSSHDGHKVSFEPEQTPPPKLAFLGVRACEIAALAVQDRVLMGSEFIDPDYMVRRANVMVVAVQCTTSASTCFCTSMGTGPEVTQGYDLLLTELDAGFLVDAGTPAGRSSWTASPAGREQRRAVRCGGHGCRGARPDRDPIPADGLHDRLLAQLDHPRWAQVAERASPAGTARWRANLLLHDLSQTTDMSGLAALASRSWDSCFSPGFAKVAGGSFRARPRDRYRQWLTTSSRRVGPVRHVGLRRLRPLHHVVSGRDRRAR